MHCRIAIWGLHSLFRPVLKHLVHVHSGLLQHLILDMGVDIRCRLIISMSHNLHGHQRVDAAFVEQGDVVVPEIVRVRVTLIGLKGRI